MELAVQNVSHAFGPLEVLRDVSFTVAQGEIVAVVGPSGCGKSTLLGILGGLLQPDCGRVAIQGDAPAGSLNALTFVFQDFALLPWRSVAANVALPLEHRDLGPDRRRAMTAEALARTGLGDFADAFPKQLSGGMRQRVGIARALAVRPALFLMDEPLSALDSQTREILMEDFVNLWEVERIGAVYVTHNLDEALRLADRVIVLSRRPGEIRHVLPVTIPRRERAAPAARAELTRLHASLWSLIRDGAIAAEREMAHG